LRSHTSPDARRKPDKKAPVEETTTSKNVRTPELHHQMMPTSKMIRIMKRIFLYLVGFKEY
jgi:hypothetical protein